MPIPFSLYEPREDSYLLAEQVAKYAKGTVLDMGCGTGIQAKTAAKRKAVKAVLAVDIQPKVIAHCRQMIDAPKIRFRVSDLFARVLESFDTIVFNPPYLPEEQPSDVALDGGKYGSALLERFLHEAPEHLNPDGQILIVFSSRSGQERIHAAIASAMLEHQHLSQEHIFFEDLFVYRLWKSDVRKELEQHGFTDIRKLTKGHRGFIYLGRIGKRSVAVKIQRPDSPAKGTVRREAKVLKLLNVHGIGPRLLFAGKDCFGYRFIAGAFVEEWVRRARRPAIVKMLRQVLAQMRTLDKLKLNKQEMHHPHKHIIVDRNGKPWLVDFERARKVARPKNVTQFCQYLRSRQFGGLLRRRGVKIDAQKLTAAARTYRRESNERAYRTIAALL